MNPSPSEKVFLVRRIARDSDVQREDLLAVEEPMEIRVVFGPEKKRVGKSLSITMRTPGNDFELAAGFLFSEGVVSEGQQLRGFEHIGPVPKGETLGNTVQVELQPNHELDIQRFQRHFYTTSSCGVCGKSSLDAIRNLGIRPIEDSRTRVEHSLIGQLPDRLKHAQSAFAKTGGIHAAGLFDADGNLISAREDVGRHNALDKLIGQQLLDKNVPLTGKIIVISGRASFELVQKTVAAGAEFLVAVGAPSSLAVELATDFNLTLVGFAAKSRLNVYATGERII